MYHSQRNSHINSQSTTRLNRQQTQQQKDSPDNNSPSTSSDNQVFFKKRMNKIPSIEIIKYDVKNMTIFNQRQDEQIQPQQIMLRSQIPQNIMNQNLNQGKYIKINKDNVKRQDLIGNISQSTEVLQNFLGKIRNNEQNQNIKSNHLPQFSMYSSQNLQQDLK
ncbi:UNKNOWN [Stylonychia lemnae]|uniref:Uncharacterized protein n=1 Tax=Stylonychia lemnae TaxID=5949 RepID=A0A078AEE3_STYLE|nr:UNKNOWN [Stylonychia lemnae]|eukprot:CDW80634.1 UNKNOWN [Stylonychia lemnae]